MSKPPSQPSQPANISFEIYLIQLVKKYPVLYDPNHPDYNKNDVKNDVWNEIKETMNNPAVSG